MPLALTILFFIGLGMLLFSCAFWLAAMASVSVLMHRRSHRKTGAAARGDWPAVSILKPLKGEDPQALSNFASFCRQEYPGKVELLFAVDDPADTAVPVVRQLQAEHPTMQVRLMVAPRLGTNPKTALLHHLAQHASGDVLVLSDSDVRVGPQYLQQVVQPLRDQPRVGLVTCPYRVAHACGATARLEALGRTGFLVPAAIFAATMLGEPLGLGATIAVRRRDLEQSGGFAAIADHLADDNRLARQIHDLGLAIYMSDEVVSIVSDGWCGSLRGLWERELRWGRAERVGCGTFKYIGMVLTFTITLALVVLISERFRTGGWPMWTVALCGGAMLLRLGTAWRSAALLGHRLDGFDLLLMVPRALLSPVIWGAAMAGREVRWRGQHFLLHRDGRLERLAAIPRRRSIPSRAAATARARHATLSAAARLLNAITHRVDQTLRRRQGIREFSHDPRCVLRVSAEVAPYTARLSDHIVVEHGDPVLELHFWSERLLRIADAGPSLGWAREMKTRAEVSLSELARAVQDDPTLAGAVAIHGTGSFVARHGSAQLERMLARLGFDMLPDPRPRTLRRRLHDLGENILIWMLTRAYNPNSLEKKPLLGRQRQQVWMSKQMLLSRYGPAEEARIRPAAACLDRNPASEISFPRPATAALAQKGVA